MSCLTPAKVNQNDFRPGKGNALQAAIASIFQLSLQEVPNFIESPEGYESAIQSFCHGRGITMEKITLSKDVKLSEKYNGKYCVLRGVSPRGDHGHVVVARYRDELNDFEMIHDPHPDETYLDKDGGYGWAMFFW